MAIPIAIVAIVIVLAVVIYLGARAASPRHPQMPMPDTSVRPAAPKVPGTAEPPSPTNQIPPTTDRNVTFLGARAVIPDPSATNGMPVGTAVPRIKRISKEQEALQANYRYPTPGQARLPDGYIVTFKPPKEGHTVKFMIDREKYICHPDGTFEIIAHKPVFEDKFEEEMISLAQPGATFLPHVLLNHTEDELKAMLAREVVINPDDSDEVKEKKEAVAEMKKMLSDYLADGGDYVNFVMEMNKYSREERKLRVKGISKLQDLLDEGLVDEARAFLKSYNEILDENGFAALRLSKKIKAQLEEAELQKEVGREESVEE
jgi:hypothetical protein